MEKPQKSKKKIKDSIAISKGYHKIHEVLMAWRRNIYIFLLLESLLVLTYAAFEIFFLINSLETANLCWVLIFLVNNEKYAIIKILLAVLHINIDDFRIMFPLFYWAVEIKDHFICVDQINHNKWINKTYFFFLRSGIDSIVILAFSLAEGIYRKAKEKENLEFKNLRIYIPIVFGIVTFLLMIIKAAVYFKIILKTDLSGQKNLIKKGLC